MIIVIDQTLVVFQALLPADYNTYKTNNSCLYFY